MFKQIDSLFEAYDRVDSPGCALGVVLGNELAYARGYGMATLEQKVEITPNTAFDIGSEAKQFTAACILLLAQSARISLQDDIRQWFPELPDYEATITVQHLIHHTSGIPEYYDELERSGLIDKPLSHQEYLDFIFRKSHLDFQPGKKASYCNSGYVLLAELVRRVERMPFSQFAKRSIFEPLGMSNTVVYDQRNMALPDHATGYIVDESGEFHAKHYWNYTVPGDGKVYSTVRDLFLWDQNLYLGTVGGQKFSETMLTCGCLNNGQRCKYAFGLDRGEFAPGEHRGLPIVTHGGGCAGGQAVMIRFVQQRLTVILLCNTRNSRFNELAFRVSDVFLDTLPNS